MKEKFKNKYRSDTIRIQGWNYGSKATYFITIVTKGRDSFFGKIINNKVELNEIGRIAEKEWHKTIELRPDMNLKIGPFIVMPNHFHGVIEIGENEYNKQETRNKSLNNVKGENPNKNKFGPQSKNLASIIRGYKSSVTVQSRKINSEFGWQANYFESMIRDTESYKKIEYYIINNPKNWKEDDLWK